MLMVIFALLAMPVAQQSPASPQVMASAAAPVPETPAQAAERRRLDRLAVVCSRRAPTGSRLDRTECQPRDRAELLARANRQDTEDYINSTGIVKGLD